MSHPATGSDFTQDILSALSELELRLLAPSAEDPYAKWQIWSMQNPVPSRDWLGYTQPPLSHSLQSSSSSASYVPPLLRLPLGEDIFYDNSYEPATSSVGIPPGLVHHGATFAEYIHPDSPTFGSGSVGYYCKGGPLLPEYATSSLPDDERATSPSSSTEYSSSSSTFSRELSSCTSPPSTPEPWASDVDMEDEVEEEEDCTSGSDFADNEHADTDYEPSTSKRRYRFAYVPVKRARASTSSSGVQRVPRPRRATRTSPYPSSDAASPAPSTDIDSLPPAPYESEKKRMRQTSCNSRSPSLPKSALKTKRCPECDYRPSEDRLSDLTRHYKCHFGEQSREWVCCGVPVDRASEYPIKDLSQVYEHNGEARVGSCWLVFSRKDALTRHLRGTKTAKNKGKGEKEKERCICDILPPEEYQK